MLNFLSESVSNLLIIKSIQNLSRVCCCLTDLIGQSHNTWPHSNAKRYFSLQIISFKGDINSPAVRVCILQKDLN